MIYNTTENCINFWNNTEWRSLCGGSTSPFVCGDPITFTYKGSNVTYGTLVSANGRCWLDRNLGASQVATSKTDAGAYGDLFQWGRLDDGHQTKTSSVTAVQSATDTPGHNDFIANPNIEDWRNPHNNNLWQGVNGINNPCPDGFRIPTIAEWQTEVLSWSSQNANGAFNSPLKLTMAGERYQYSGEVRSLGTAGNYWSSKTVVDLGSGLNVSEKIYYENTFVNNNASEYRNFGASVRCIKD